MPSALQTLDVEEGIASVHEALNLGINFFDTSPYYGITKSEKVGFAPYYECHMLFCLDVEGNKAACFGIVFLVELLLPLGC